MVSYLKRFDDIPIYQDEGSQGQTCRDILPGGVVDGLSLGYNILDGPGHVGRNHHTWDQVFVVVKGSGVLELGDERIPLQPETIVLIPAFTDHDTLVKPGEHIEYVYVNKAREDKSNG
jgi:mannose-6-phosphate isomerase-like protein (cupin superfamily)